jgi:hypothetical protein
MPCQRSDGAAAMSRWYSSGVMWCQRLPLAVLQTLVQRVVAQLQRTNDAEHRWRWASQLLCRRLVVLYARHPRPAKTLRATQRLTSGLWFPGRPSVEVRDYDVDGIDDDHELLWTDQNGDRCVRYLVTHDVETPPAQDAPRPVRATRRHRR